MDRWDDLKFLLAIERHGTMAAAARALGTNPATVSRRMERMADELGMNPVIKTPAGWGTNPEVQGLIEASDRFHEEVEREKNRLRFKHGLQSAEIRVACSPLISGHILIPALAECAAEMENIQLSFHNRAMIETLSGNDVIISVVRPRAGRLISRKIGTITVQVFAPDRDPEIRDWVGLGADVREFEPMIRAERYFGQPPRIHVDTFDHVLLVMRATGLAGLLPRASGLDMPGFVAVAETAEACDLYMSYHESRRGDPAITQVTRFIAQSVAQSIYTRAGEGLTGLC
jgi:DNA-binding transcriptional LysR family regulator